MYEFHGWATIRESTIDIDDGHLTQIVTEIQLFVKNMNWPNGLIDFIMANGLPTLSVAGYRNHEDSVVSELFELYALVARIAPGSYGLIYVWNDEDPLRKNEFKVFVLARGHITEHKDAFLSPCIPVIEDLPGNSSFN